MHNRINFRYFAVGGLVWYITGAILFESNAFFMKESWLAELPFQLLGLPHWFAFQSPQIRSVSNLTILDPLEMITESLRISPWHFDAVIGAGILTVAVYGVYRLARAFRTPEARQAWSLFRMALKS